MKQAINSLRTTILARIIFQGLLIWWISTMATVLSCPSTCLVKWTQKMWHGILQGLELPRSFLILTVIIIIMRDRYVILYFMLFSLSLEITCHFMEWNITRIRAPKRVFSYWQLYNIIITTDWYVILYNLTLFSLEINFYQFP